MYEQQTGVARMVTPSFEVEWMCVLINFIAYFYWNWNLLPQSIVIVFKLWTFFTDILLHYICRSEHNVRQSFWNLQVSVVGWNFGFYIYWFRNIFGDGTLRYAGPVFKQTCLVSTIKYFSVHKNFISGLGHCTCLWWHPHLYFSRGPDSVRAHYIYIYIYSII